MTLSKHFRPVAKASFAGVAQYDGGKLQIERQHQCQTEVPPVCSERPRSKGAEPAARKTLFLNQCREETVELEVIKGVTWSP